MAKVQILLSTWNGERWLAELLESLLQQDESDWELWVRDDGSQDRSVKVLLDWQRAHPEKLVRLEADGQRLGYAQSFSRLVMTSDAPYLMFCDQDDVWFPDKISRQLRAVRALESVWGREKPLLVHTDLTLVNARQRPLAHSFWEHRGFDLTQQKQDYLLTNTVTGCATLFNRAAADKAFPLPESIDKHDRWLALVCAWFGEIHSLSGPAVFYRQHEANAIGAESMQFSQVNSMAMAERIANWSQQAEVFLARYGDDLLASDYRLIAALAELRHLKGWERRKYIMQHRLFKQGVLANLALLWFA